MSFGIYGEPISTEVNQAISQNDRLDGGFYMSGTGSEISIVEDITTPEASVFLFFNITSLVNDNYLFLSNGVSSNDRLFIYVTTGGEIRAAIQNASNSTETYITGTTINTNEEHVVGLKYDGTNIKIYLDSKLIHEEACSAAHDNLTLSFEDIHIGGNANGFRTIGEINRVRVFNRAVSDSEMVNYSKGQSAKFLDYIQEKENVFYKKDIVERSSAQGMEILDDKISGTNESGSTKFFDVYDADNGFNTWKQGGTYRLTFTYEGTCDATFQDDANSVAINGSSGTVTLTFTKSTTASAKLYFRVATSSALNISGIKLTPVGEIIDLIPSAATQGGWRNYFNNFNGRAVGEVVLRSKKAGSLATRESQIVNKSGSGPAFFFDGVNGKIDGLKESPINNNSFTWVVHCHPADTNGIYGLIYAIGSGAYANRRYFRYDYGEYDFTIGNSSSPVFTHAHPPVPAVLAVVHDERTNKAELYIDGVKRTEVVHSNQHDFKTVPMSNNVLDIGAFGGGTYFKGEISKVRLFNRVLTPTEIERVSNDMALPYADSETDGVLLEDSDFSAGTDSYLAVGGALVGNVGPIDGEDDVLEYTINSSSGVHGVQKNIGMVLNKRYRVTLKYRINSANSNITGIAVYCGTGNRTTVYARNKAPTDTWVDVSEEIICGQDFTNIVEPEKLTIYALDANNTTVITDAGGDDIFYLKNVCVEPLGETLSLLPSGIASSNWYDSGSARAVGTVSGGAYPINVGAISADYFVSLANLPTTSAGLPSGRVWNDSGTLKVV